MMSGDFVVLIALHVMEHEHSTVSRGQFFNRTFQIDPVYRAC